MPSVLSHFKAARFGREYLLAALDRCTDEVLDYRPPTPTGHTAYSLREQFLHIADVGEMFVYELIGASEMPEEHWRVQREEDGSPRLNGEWPTVADLRRELERSWEYQDRNVFFVPDDQMITPISKDGQCSPAYIAGWLIFHESQHRGQIMTYLRMAGIEPPEW